MKREILCLDCNRETSRIKTKDLLITAEDIEEAGGAISLPLPIPEEVKKSSGEARMQLHCDLCNNVIVKGEQCIARSIIGHGQIYEPWEHDYVK